MRIAIFSWESSYTISIGGIAVHVSELAAALQRNNQVHVFTRIGPNQSIKDEKFHDRGVTYHFIPYYNTSDLLKNPNDICNSFFNKFELVENEMLNGQKFQVVHCHDWMLSPVLSRIKKEVGRPCVFTMHSTEYGRCGNVLYKDAEPSSTIIEYERSCTINSDVLIAISNSLKSEIIDLYKIPDDKVNVIYNGVACNEFAGEIDPGEIKREYNIGPLDPTVLFVGRMTIQKAPDLFIDAVPAILKIAPQAKFIFVGEGHLKQQVIERAKQLEVFHACVFLDRTSRDALIKLYKACQCVIVPSRNEPFGLVILEAWAAGKPVIATRNGGPSEIVWDNVTGYQIDPNAASIAYGISKLFEDFNHASWMGQNGYEAAKSAFSWEMVASHTFDTYRQAREKVGANY